MQHERGAWGVIYDSVRHPEGRCIAAFKPRACRPVRQGSHFEYYYDGESITHVARLTALAGRGDCVSQLVAPNFSSFRPVSLYASL